MNKPILPKIKSAESLKYAIQVLEQRIQVQEEVLAKRWNRLPMETFQTLLGAIMPSLIYELITSGGWKLLKGAIGLFSTKRKKSP
jgi:hypothetical protein